MSSYSYLRNNKNHSGVLKQMSFNEDDDYFSGDSDTTLKVSPPDNTNFMNLAGDPHFKKSKYNKENMYVFSESDESEEFKGRVRTYSYDPENDPENYQPEYKEGLCAMEQIPY